MEALRSLGVTALFDRNSNMTGISDQRIVIDLVMPVLCPSPSRPRSAPLGAPADTREKAGAREHPSPAGLLWQRPQSMSRRF